MDKEKAKMFVYCPNSGEKKMYFSKDLQKLIDMNDGYLFWIYAVLDTPSGETLMHMDFAYSGEPIIMDRFVHLDYFIKHYWYFEHIYI